MRSDQYKVIDVKLNEETDIPPGMSIAWRFCLVLIVALAIPVAFLSFTRSEHATGIVESTPGAIKIYSQFNSVVSKVHVKEGSFVRAGQALLTVSEERQLASRGGAQVASGVQTRAKQNILREELENIETLYEAEARQLQQQVASKKASVQKLRDELDIRERLVRSSRDSTARKLQLASSGFISKDGLAEDERKLLQAEATLKTSDRELLAASTELNDLLSNQATLASRRSRDTSPLSRQIAATEQELIDYASKGEVMILAPCDGTVAMIAPTQGETVVEKRLMISFLPAEAKLVVNVYVPGSAIGLISKNSPVLLRYESYPYQKFGEHPGTIKAVSLIASSESELAIGALPKGTYYRLEVEPIHPEVRRGKEVFQLRYGMAVEAEIDMDTRKIWEWIIEPLSSSI